MSELSHRKNQDVSPQTNQMEVMPAVRALGNPRLYVEAWMRNRGISLSARRVLRSSDNRIWKLSAVSGTCWLDFREQLQAMNFDIERKARETDSRARRLVGFTKEDFDAALREYIDRQAEAALDRKKAELKCVGEDLTLVRRMVRAWTGDENPVIVAAVSHWMWMVKRKLNGLPVIDHLMLILRGRQNGGKSTAVGKFVGVLGDWKTELPLDQLMRDQNANAFQDNFISLLDEMQDAERCDIDALKHRVTASAVEGRILHKNWQERFQQNLSFIGTSNRYVDEIFYDTSGMRRFVEIAASETLDHEVINSLDYDAMWKGIDEGRPEGYLKPVLEELRAIQQKMTAVDPVTEFCTEAGLVPVPGGEMTWVSVEAVYRYYFRWAERNGVKPVNAAVFSRRCRHCGIESDRKYLDGRQQRCLGVAASWKRLSLSGDAGGIHAG